MLLTHPLGQRARAKNGSLSSRCRDARRRLELSLHLFLQQVPHVVEVANLRGCADDAGLARGDPRRLPELEVQLLRSPREPREDRRQLETILEEREAPEDVEPESRAAHTHDQPADVAKVTHMLRSHEGHDDIVVLLPLELVDRRDFGGLAEQRVPSAALSHDVAKQCLLAVVRRDDRDLRRGVAQQAHVHEERDGVLGLSEVLEEVRRRLRFALAIEVLHIDELVVERKADVRFPVPSLHEDVLEISQVPVTPAVKFGDLGPRSALQVEVDRRRFQAHEAGVQRLVQMPVLLESAVLHHWGKLVVVAYEHDALEPAGPVVRLLQEHRDERLHL
mmetsp:Transcript_86182/g.241048  ORF Transcript_86182/g.241048 Transcript_86182/m.241048 type:complete len:334 (+) Transcript_86182:35-1036(+)